MIKFEPIKELDCKHLIDMNEHLHYALIYNRNRHNSVFDSKIREILDMSQKELDDSYVLINQRTKDWEKVLFSYYRMTQKKVTKDGFVYTKNSLIYPYRIIKENMTLWFLEVNCDDSYMGGINDTNMSIDTDWDYEITLEPITKEEFINTAKQRVEDIFKIRMDKIEFERNESLD